MKKAILIGLLLVVGCQKGEKGDKGDPGPGQVFLYQGALNSNDQSISCSKLTTSSVVNVYIVSTDTSVNTIQLPMYAPGIATNVFYKINSGSIVEIINGQTISGYWYKIYIINGAQQMAQGSGLARLLP